MVAARQASGPRTSNLVVGPFRGLAARVALVPPLGYQPAAADAADVSVPSSSHAQAWLGGRLLASILPDPWLVALVYMRLPHSGGLRGWRIVLVRCFPAPFAEMGFHAVVVGWLAKPSSM